jgi:hypothetical protein
MLTSGNDKPAHPAAQVLDTVITFPCITIQSRKTIAKKPAAPKPKTEAMTPKKPAMADK